MHASYEDDAYFEGGEAGYSSYQAQEATLRPTFRRFLGELARRGMTGGRLLEVGCAYGFFLDEAKGFFDHRAGTDYSPGGPGTGPAAGPTASCWAAPSRSPPGEPFDCIACIHVIEHIYDPVGFLRTLAAHLRPGGWLRARHPRHGELLAPADALPLALFQDPRARHLLRPPDAAGAARAAPASTSVRPLPYASAFSLELIGEKLGRRCRDAWKDRQLWLPATTIAAAGRKPVSGQVVVPHRVEEAARGLGRIVRAVDSPPAADEPALPRGRRPSAASAPSSRSSGGGGQNRQRRSPGGAEIGGHGEQRSVPLASRRQPQLRAPRPPRPRRRRRRSPRPCGQPIEAVIAVRARVVAPVEEGGGAADPVDPAGLPDRLGPVAAGVPGFDRDARRRRRLGQRTGELLEVLQRPVAEDALAQPEMALAGEAEDPGSIALAREGPPAGAGRAPPGAAADPRRVVPAQSTSCQIPSSSPRAGAPAGGALRRGPGWRPRRVDREEAPRLAGEGAVLPDPLLGGRGVAEAVGEKVRERGEVLGGSGTEDRRRRQLFSPRWRSRMVRTSRSIENEERMGSTRESGELTQITPTSATLYPRRRASQISSTS